MTPADLPRLEQRVTDLEMLLTHLERQLAEQNEAVLVQGRIIERLQADVRRLLKPAEEPEDDAGE